LDSARAPGVMVSLSLMSRSSLAEDLARVELVMIVIGTEVVTVAVFEAVALMEAAEVLLEAGMLILVVQEAVVYMYLQMVVV
jgi:hypothetical protein